MVHKLKIDKENSILYNTMMDLHKKGFITLILSNAMQYPVLSSDEINIIEDCIEISDLNHELKAIIKSDTIIGVAR